jgi:hypothetical protein
LDSTAARQARVAAVQPAEHAGHVAARLVAQEPVDGVALGVLGAQIAREQQRDAQEEHGRRRR